MQETEKICLPLNRLVLGTAGLGGVWGAVNEEASVSALVNALARGIAKIDTSPSYGDAEKTLGLALRDHKGAVPEISTKVGRLKSYRSDIGQYDYTPLGMATSVANSLKELGLTTVDVLFLHEPAAIPLHQIKDAVQEMLALKNRGYAKRIGLGGNYPKHFQTYLKAGVFDVVMEYNRLNCCSLDALNSSLRECSALGVEYWAASPLHMGLLGRRFEEFTQTKPGWIEQDHLEKAKIANQIAQNAQLALPQTALRFLQQLPFPFQIVVGASNQQELDETFSALEQGPLAPSVYTALLQLVHQIKYNELHNVPN